MELKVKWYIDNIYQVVQEYEDGELSIFQGSISDCESFIRLTNSGTLKT